MATTARDPAVGAALVDWVNTFNLRARPSKLPSLADLYDGSIISLILHDIDAKYFGDGIVQRKTGSASVNWVQHFNLCKSPWRSSAHHARFGFLYADRCVLTVKKLLRSITDYYGDVLRTNPPNLPAEEMPNLSSIAKEKSTPDIVKLLRLVLALAVKSDKKEEYVQRIYTLSPEAQKSLMLLLQQVIAEPSQGYSPRSGMINEDDQIRLEQEMAEITADRDAIENARLILLEEHEELKAEAKRLKASLDAAETRAREAEEAARSLGSKADSYLRSELDRLQLELQDIEAKTTQKDKLLESRNTLLTGLNRQIDELRPRAEQATRFEEELKEASTELAQTHKKVQRLENIVEKYKAKAEESNVLLRQNELLEDENTQLKETLRKIDPKQSVLRARDDLARIDSFERAWLEERRALELEAEKLRETLKSAEEQTKRDVAIIAALEERLKDSVATEPNSLNDLDGEDLNDELNTSRKSLRLQVARLEREVAAAKAEAEFNRLAADKNGQTDVKLRERFVKYETELSAANRKISDLTLIASQSTKPSASEVQTRMEQLLRQLAALEDDKRKLAQEKDDLQQQLLKQKDQAMESERDAGRLKLSLATLEGEAGGQTKGETLQLQKSVRELTTELKFKDAEIQKMKDLIKKRDQTLKESKAKLAKATAGADKALRDENAELLKRLNLTKKSHREEAALKNKELLMMTSAFHDLGSRIQLNSFIVEKQAHAPASFLAQQRNSIPSLSKKD